MGSTTAVPAPARAGARQAARPSRWHARTLAAAGTIPVTAVNAAGRLSCRSEGHHPANDRPAIIPACVYDSGSGHGHDAAPACHPHPARPPPRRGGDPGRPSAPSLRGRPSAVKGACGVAAATGLRPALDPGDLCGPSRAATTGQATACPRHPRRHPPGHRTPPARNRQTPPSGRAAHPCSQTSHPAHQNPRSQPQPGTGGAKA